MHRFFSSIFRRIHKALSRKQTSPESTNDLQNNEVSAATLQKDDDDKGGKLAALGDTALDQLTLGLHVNDLPMEMLECILVKVVAMEVKDLKLPKGSVWKEKGDLVINKLKTVCSQWDSVLTTNFFRNELRRALSDIAPETIRMEILHQSVIHRMVIRITTLKDELLVLNLRPVNRLNVRVYDLNNMMAKVKHVFVLPRIKPADIAACNVTGCFYVLEQHREPIATLIFRITRVDKHYIHVRTWIRDRSSSVDSISVSAEGNLIIISTQREHHATAVSVFNLNGSLQHRVILSPEVYGFKHINSAIQKSNGNLVLTYVSQQFRLVLIEIDANGKIEREYKSSMSASSCANFADSSGRIIICDPRKRMELLDSELNLLDFSRTEPYQEDIHVLGECHSIHYNAERNEVVDFRLAGRQSSVITIFRFNGQ